MCHGATPPATASRKRTASPRFVTLQDDRIRKMADGEISTPSQTEEHDDGLRSNDHRRGPWAVIAYLRALQRSQNATINDCPSKAGPRWTNRRTNRKLKRRRRRNERTSKHCRPRKASMSILRASGIVDLVCGGRIGRAASRRGRGHFNPRSSVFPSSLLLPSISRFAPAAFLDDRASRCRREWSVVVRRQLENIARFSSSWRFLHHRARACAIIFTNGMNVRPHHDESLDLKRAY